MTWIHENLHRHVEPMVFVLYLMFLYRHRGQVSEPKLTDVYQECHVECKDECFIQIATHSWKFLHF